VNQRLLDGVDRLELQFVRHLWHNFPRGCWCLLLRLLLLWALNKGRCCFWQSESLLLLEFLLHCPKKLPLLQLHQRLQILLYGAEVLRGGDAVRLAVRGSIERKGRRLRRQRGGRQANCLQNSGAGRDGVVWVRSFNRTNTALMLLTLVLMLMLLFLVFSQVMPEAWGGSRGGRALHLRAAVLMGGIGAHDGARGVAVWVRSSAMALGAVKGAAGPVAVVDEGRGGGEMWRTH
jgi:hypothetical protein